MSRLSELMKIYRNIYNRIISLENLFLAWDTFKHDKGHKKDVGRFDWHLEENIFQLHRDLASKKYHHDRYSSFYITDPKQRHIHKAIVRDRVLHHAIVRILTPIFEPTFIAKSFSCRVGKGTHKGVSAVELMTRQVSKNYTRPCFALKCDIKKFFNSINHRHLLAILERRIADPDTIWLLRDIVGSFRTDLSDVFNDRGLPIGNLTSQLFANVYMNEFDQFVKHELRIQHYARYTDDFVILSSDMDYLLSLLEPIQSFLKRYLDLELHEGKTSIRKLGQGIDFLGYTILPHYRLVRTKTRRRIFKKVDQRIEEYHTGVMSRESLEQSLNSYLGVLCHANEYTMSEDLKNRFWFELKSTN
ncbi:reverse transcriptase/maturase family protein [Patescibacteria group bacterium]|nr:reverse transcriptase/maturase family protein [Patescibacteria group bacterium]